MKKDKDLLLCKEFIERNFVYPNDSIKAFKNLRSFMSFIKDNDIPIDLHDYINLFNLSILFTKTIAYIKPINIDDKNLALLYLAHDVFLNSKSLIKTSSDTINKYLNYLPKDILDRDDENRLFKQYYKGSKDDFIEIFKHNLVFLVLYVQKFNINNIDLEDVIEEGSIGLIKAIYMYSIKFDERFITYAFPYIKKEISNYLSNNYSISCNNYLPPFCIEEDIINKIRLEDFKKIINELRNLNNRDFEILKLKYGIDCDELTYQSIANIYGLTRQRIYQIINRILNKLKLEEKIIKLK